MGEEGDKELLDFNVHTIICGCFPSGDGNGVGDDMLTSVEAPTLATGMGEYVNKDDDG